MTKEQLAVREFNQMTGNIHDRTPHVPHITKQFLGENLILEELAELAESYRRTDLIEIADALGDLLYVVLWNADLCGIDLEPVFNEVHRSNMTKLWTLSEIEEVKREPGSTVVAVSDVHLTDRHRRAFVVKRADGKVIKSPSYEQANIAAIVEAQR